MMRRPVNPPPPEVLALKALTFLGNSEGGFDRFLWTSGLQPQELAARVEESGVQTAILDFLLADEALLLAFCEAESLQPKEIHRAKYRLEGNPDV